MYDWSQLMSTSDFWSKAKADLSHLKGQEKFEHISDFKRVMSLSFNRHGNKKKSVDKKKRSGYENKDLSLENHFLMIIPFFISFNNPELIILPLNSSWITLVATLPNIKQSKPECHQDMSRQLRDSKKWYIISIYSIENRFSDKYYDFCPSLQVCKVGLTNWSIISKR